MLINVQTKLNPPTTVYDSQAPSSGIDAKTFGKKVLKWLEPVIQVQQGDTVLYKSKEFYPDESGKYYALFGGALALASVAILGLGRLTKR